jgi:UDP-N-acetylglucosamine diphosphorylase / glucose-1-phosphate thymidylyltransferase / UDP-N-acetylgalactosamine diphosphorylase / glucosamine-1-phosphate N-acetyltransferase / galactosamine-1-phosphate N-acetyltransferase
MNSLTDTVPKPMLTVAGKTLLEHKFDALPQCIDEIILVVGYQGEVIRRAYGDSYAGKTLRYIEQEVLDGTGGSLWKAAPLLHKRFLVMMGDDLYAPLDIEACVAIDDWALLIQRTESMGMGGKMEVDDTDVLVGIDEGDHRGKPGLFNTNMFVLDPRIFEYPLLPKAPGSTEYGLPHTVLGASQASGIPIHVVYATNWIQITAPEDLSKAEALIEETKIT